MNRKLLFSFCAILSIASTVQATIIVIGNGTLPFSFDVTGSPTGVNVETFDPVTGTLYVGLSAASPGTSGAAGFSIASINRFASAPAIIFSQITFAGTTDTNPLTNQDIRFLSTATSNGVPTPFLAGSISSEEGTPGTTVFATTINTATSSSETTATPNTVEVSDPLLDANPVVNANGEPTDGIVGLAANTDFIFAAVRPHGTSTTFGEVMSGIAVVAIDIDPSKKPPVLTGVTQTAAQAGDMGIKAKLLDPTIAQVQDDPVPSSNLPTITEPTFPPVPARVPLYWDSIFNRLYVGLTITANDTGSHSAKSVVVARVITNIADPGILELSNIAPSAAFTPATAANQNEIVVGKQNNSASFTLQTNFVSVMHASTGPSYLIVNGGNQTGNVVSSSLNKIFALPLLDLSDAAGNVSLADEPLQGTLADKNSPLTNFKYTLPASAPGDLVKDPTTASAGPIDAFSLVGGNPLALLPDNSISDMKVLGDMVYVSFNIPQDDENETGVIYSQALFDESGIIIGWTPWAKRAFPFMGFLGHNNPCRVKFAEIDAVTGRVWAVGGDNALAVATSVWDRGIDPTTLIVQLNRALCKGCYSVLDLDSFTNDFNPNTPDRYAAFGGLGTVAFARTSQSRATVAPFSAIPPTVPQYVTIDYSLPINFLVTSLFDDVAATSLEFSRKPSTAENYFFAGSQQGLYVFSDNGSGFTQSAMTTLDMPPFSSGQWQKVTNIKGDVLAVKTIGNNLYVLTFTSSATTPLQNKVYSIPFAPTVAAMFPAAEPTIIAQTGVGVFANIFSFSDIQLISTLPVTQSEQVVLTTNNGIFQSTTAGGVQTATNQTTAAWTIIPEPNGETSFWVGISGMDPFINAVNQGPFPAQNPTVVWPFSLEDELRLKTFQRGSIFQLIGTTNAGPYQFIPEKFNGLSDNPASLVTIQRTTDFWTDGGRRFFIGTLPTSKPTRNYLFSFPYNATTWSIHRANQQLLSDPGLQTQSSFNWVKQIGITGLLMAGGNHGVVSLE